MSRCYRSGREHSSNPMLFRNNKLKKNKVQTIDNRLNKSIPGKSRKKEMEDSIVDTKTKVVKAKIIK